MTGPGWRHGTLGGYTNHGCRCEGCRKAQRDWSREYNYRTGRRRRPEDRPGRTHGRISTYNAGCRCDDCRTAATAAKRRYRQRAREATA